MDTATLAAALSAASLTEHAGALNPHAAELFASLRTDKPATLALLKACGVSTLGGRHRLFNALLQTAHSLPATGVQAPTDRIVVICPTITSRACFHKSIIPL